MEIDFNPFLKISFKKIQAYLKKQKALNTMKSNFNTSDMNLGKTKCSLNKTYYQSKK